ncbi:hypothetical protein [Roseivirga pacifica]|uniref:hypothetical protein n=1 Tax=Roseivirga pacifica TaxID=1267423 RepID=UPI003BAEF43A
MRKYCLILCGVLSLSCTIVMAQEEDGLVDSLLIHSDIFAFETPAKISLKMDVKAFKKAKYTDKYLPAELSYKLDSINEAVVKQVRIKARGNSRRQKCFFPPIKLNIRKADVKNDYLSETKTIKLVTHCNSALVNRRYLLKEYLAYKLYQVVSPYSFRVRLVQMEYIDTGKRGKNIDTWAFLIEPIGVMAERLDMLNVKSDNLRDELMDRSIMTTLDLFQYMIGNADYSVQGRHNMKVIRSKDVMEQEGVPVPYDFDYSGLVDAGYAVPGDQLGIDSVKERYFLGACKTEAEIEEAVVGLKAKKPELFEVIDTFEYLNSKEKTAMKRYLEEFFSAVEKNSFYNYSILSTCK